MRHNPDKQIARQSPHTNMSVTHRHQIRTKFRETLQDDDEDPEIGGMVLDIRLEKPNKSFFDIHSVLSQIAYNRWMKSLKLVGPIISAITLINSFRILEISTTG